MAAQDFAKFVASQQGSPVENVDWTATLKEWLKDLEGLYETVEGYLAEFIANESIAIEYTETTMTEEYLGTYNARRMQIRIGRTHVFLEPIATLLIGSKGRVDAIGPAKRGQLMLIDQKAKGAWDLVRITAKIITDKPEQAFAPPQPSEPIVWRWKIVKPGLRMAFLDLDKNSFFEFLMEVAGE